MQKLIATINIKESKKIINIIIFYIRNNFIFRRKKCLLKLSLTLL